MDRLLSGNFSDPQVKQSLIAAWNSFKEDLPPPQIESLLTDLSQNVANSFLWYFLIPLVVIIIVILLLAGFLSYITWSGAIIGIVIIVLILILLWLFSSSINCLFNSSRRAISSYSQNYLDSIGQQLPSSLEKAYNVFTSYLVPSDSDLEEDFEFET